ncbi:MAG: DUF72 domain-containing protein [Bacteroidota bacterium]|nr:DUF72 domain-containing protein [Bacteroidota bacterium]
MIHWHIGCSGFHYKHWKEIFYPKNVPQRLWFEFYSQHFNTLELNVTFYRFPEVAMLKSWYQRSAPDFSFSVKAPRLITHYKKMNDCEELLADFYHTIEKGLKEKTGCVLFQFPPRFDYTSERLDKIINNLHPEFPNVVEFRHISWWNEEVYKKLEQNKISFSGMSHPVLPDKIIVNTSLLYYRMHGVPQLYQSPYTIEDLKRIVKVIQSSTKVKKAFIYFNNDIGGSAIKNATEMIEIVK